MSTPVKGFPKGKPQITSTIQKANPSSVKKTGIVKATNPTPLSRVPFSKPVAQRLQTPLSREVASTSATTLPRKHTAGLAGGITAKTLKKGPSTAAGAGGTPGAATTTRKLLLQKKLMGPSTAASISGGRLAATPTKLKAAAQEHKPSSKIPVKIVNPITPGKSQSVPGWDAKSTGSGDAQPLSNGPSGPSDSQGTHSAVTKPLPSSSAGEDSQEQKLYNVTAKKEGYLEKIAELTQQVELHRGAFDKAVVEMQKLDLKNAQLINDNTTAAARIKQLDNENSTLTNEKTSLLTERAEHVEQIAELKGTVQAERQKNIFAETYMAESRAREERDRITSEQYKNQQSMPPLVGTTMQQKAANILKDLASWRAIAESRGETIIKLQNKIYDLNEKVEKCGRVENGLKTAKVRMQAAAEKRAALKRE